MSLGPVHKDILVLSTQARFLASRKKEVLFSGGFRCVTGSTKILTIDGEVTIEQLVKDNKAPVVLSFNGSGFEWIQAEVPYLKSYEDTLKIDTNDGKSITVAKNHAFLTTKGWGTAASCGVGEELLGYSIYPQQSNSGFYQQVLPLDVYRWIHKDIDFQYDYPLRPYLNDERPLYGLNSVQDVLPLLNDADEHNLLNLHKDDWVCELEDNHAYVQQLCLLSIHDLKNHNNYDYQQQHCSYLKTYEDVHQYSYSKLNHNEQQFASKLNRPYTFEDNYQHHNAKDIYNSQDVYHLETYNPSSSLSPFLSISIIQKISQTPHENIYDIGVPIYHNYVANGFINHNSGKSVALAYACARAASKPGANVLLCRSILWDLKNTTLDILIGGRNPVLPLGSYEHNKIERKIRLHDGGCIHYNGMDGAERIRSTSYGTICLDEASEFTAREYQEVFDRLSDDVTWYPGLRQMYLATNPSGTSHFLYRRFFLNKNSDREVIFSNSLNNFHLPKDYIRSSLESKSGVDYTKYVCGQWANNANCVYDNFDRNKHASIELEKTGYDSYYIGIDYGFKDPMAIMVIGKKGERLFILEETYQTGMLKNEILDRIKYYVNKYPDPSLIYDPSAAGLGGEIENIGLNVIKANNDISVGIARVRDMFQFHNGISNLNIDPKCINTINEIENYQYKEESDKPIDINNHLVDSLRYIINYVEDMKVEYALPTIFTMDDEDDKVEYDGFSYSGYYGA